MAASDDDDSLTTVSTPDDSDDSDISDEDESVNQDGENEDQEDEAAAAAEEERLKDIKTKLGLKTPNSAVALCGSPEPWTGDEPGFPESITIFADPTKTSRQARTLELKKIKVFVGPSKSSRAAFFVRIPTDEPEEVQVVIIYRDHRSAFGPVGKRDSLNAIADSLEGYVREEEKKDAAADPDDTAVGTGRRRGAGAAADHIDKNKQTAEDASKMNTGLRILEKILSKALDCKGGTVVPSKVLLNLIKYVIRHSGQIFMMDDEQGNIHDIESALIGRGKGPAELFRRANAPNPQQVVGVMGKAIACYVLGVVKKYKDTPSEDKKYSSPELIREWVSKISKNKYKKAERHLKTHPAVRTFVYGMGAIVVAFCNTFASDFNAAYACQSGLSVFQLHYVKMYPYLVAHAVGTSSNIDVGLAMETITKLDAIARGEDEKDIMKLKRNEIANERDGYEVSVFAQTKYAQEVSRLQEQQGMPANLARRPNQILTLPSSSEVEVTTSRQTASARGGSVVQVAQWQAPQNSSVARGGSNVPPVAPPAGSRDPRLPAGQYASKKAGNTTIAAVENQIIQAQQADAKKAIWRAALPSGGKWKLTDWCNACPVPGVFTISVPKTSLPVRRPPSNSQQPVPGHLQQHVHNQNVNSGLVRPPVLGFVPGSENTSTNNRAGTEMSFNRDNSASVAPGAPG